MSTSPPSRDGFEAFLRGNTMSPNFLRTLFEGLLAFQPNIRRAPAVAETVALLAFRSSSFLAPNNSTPSSITSCFSCFSFLRNLRRNRI